MLDELQKVSGGTNVPVLVVGTQVEKNASPDAFNQALDTPAIRTTPAGVARAREASARKARARRAGGAPAETPAKPTS